MAINTLATETLFQRTLDKLAVQEAVTGWMDANSGQVIYNGGKEVKIPKLSVQGLADYDRDNGYVMGGATMAYETLTMTQDRGRKFQLCAQLRVCNQVGGNPIYPRSSQPDNSESWDVVGNSN